MRDMIRGKINAVFWARIIKIGKFCSHILDGGSSIPRYKETNTSAMNSGLHSPMRKVLSQGEYALGGIGTETPAWPTWGGCGCYWWGRLQTATIHEVHENVQLLVQVEHAVGGDNVRVHRPPQQMCQFLLTRDVMRRAVQREPWSGVHTAEQQATTIMSQEPTTNEHHTSEKQQAREFSPTKVPQPRGSDAAEFINDMYCVYYLCHMHICNFRCHSNKESLGFAHRGACCEHMGAIFF